MNEEIKKEEKIEEPTEEEETTDEEPPKIELTLKQRIWLSEYMVHGNKTRAALVAYYPDFPADTDYKDLDEQQKKTYDAASVIGYENLRKLKIPLDQLMDEAGITDVYIVKKLKENMEATKLYGPGAVPGMDGMARNKALEIALKAKGQLIDRIDHTSKGRRILQPKIVSDVTPYDTKTETTKSS